MGLFRAMATKQGNAVVAFFCIIYGLMMALGGLNASNSEMYPISIGLIIVGLIFGVIAKLRRN